MKMSSRYALGYGEFEQDRLIAQSLRFAQITERFLSEAGVREAQRVLDVGSGLGDVALAAARLVRNSGEVIGIEQNAKSIAIARDRAAAAGYENVRFVQADLTQFDYEDSVDAVVGRFVLEFLPDPAATVRRLSRSVRRGGIVAFQEPWTSILRGFTDDLPLWNACVSVLRNAIKFCGGNPDLGSTLHHVYQDAGLPPPFTRIDMLLNDSPDLAVWGCDVALSAVGQLNEGELDVSILGDLETLRERVIAEVRNSGHVVPSVPLVGAWCRVG